MSLFKRFERFLHLQLLQLADRLFIKRLSNRNWVQLLRFDDIFISLVIWESQLFIQWPRLQLSLPLIERLELQSWLMVEHEQIRKHVFDSVVLVSFAVLVFDAVVLVSFVVLAPFLFLVFDAFVLLILWLKLAVESIDAA